MEPSTEDMWRERLAEFEASGLTATEFAKRSGLHPTTISRWKRVLAAKSKPPSGSMALARMRPGSRAVVVAAGENGGGAIELGVGRVTIRVHRGFDVDVLRAVVAALLEAR
jgi:hypothetical protein